MPVADQPYLGRIRALRADARQLARRGVLLSVLVHAGLIFALRDTSQWLPARAVPPRAPAIGYPGPTHLVDLAPLREVIADQEELARQRRLGGALLHQPLQTPRPILPETPARGETTPILPAPNTETPDDEQIVMVLGEDWTRPVSASVKAMSEEFQVLKIVRPEYPSAAIKAEIEGVVELQIRVDTQGRVAEVEVRRSPPRGFVLERAAIDAVQFWEFRPLQRDSRPAPFTVVVPFRFRLVG